MAVHLKALLEATQLLHANEVEDQTCPICYEDYLQDPSKEFPRKLPCGHIVGTECLLIWASAQTHATSIDCPWCRKAIIQSADALYLQTLLSAYVEAGFVHLETLMARAQTAVDRALDHNRGQLFALAILLLVPAMYFGTFLAGAPLRFLYDCVNVAVTRRLEPHPRRGAALLALGVCTGALYSQNLGSTLMFYGMAPFKHKMFGAFAEHFRLAGGLVLAVIALKVGVDWPVVGFVAWEAEMWFLVCVARWFLTWMME